MTWTYLSTAPGSSDRSWVRFRVHDNSSASQLFQDEEIDLMLADTGSKHEAAAQACLSLGARYAGRSDRTIGKLKIAMSDASQRYFDLADRLMAESGADAGGYAGGQSISDKQIETSDPDWMGADFTKGQFDNPRAGKQFGG